MDLSRASETSGEKCPLCGGNLRWALPADVRNVLAMILHFVAFIVSLLVIVVFGSNGIGWVLALFAGQALLLYMFRRAYRTVLQCDVCKTVIRSRDVLSTLRGRNA